MAMDKKGVWITDIEVKKPNLKLINTAINDISRKIKKYSPGYNIAVEPIFDGKKILQMELN